MKGRAALVSIAALLFASNAAAQVEVKVTAPRVPGGTAVVWDPPGSTPALYISPYTGLITATNQTVILNCVDFFHNVTLNQSWLATRTNLAIGDMVNTRFNNATLYLQAAWLTQQYGANPGAYAQRSIAIQAAIWNLMTPSAPDKTDGSGVTSQSYWLSQAQLEANWRSIDPNRFYVLTAVGASEDNTDKLQQEFLVYQSSSVPEPATLALLGSGVAVVVGAVRRRRRNVAAQPPLS